MLVSPDCANYALSDSLVSAEALDLLDTHFKHIPSLKEIVINFVVYPEQDPSHDLNEEDARLRMDCQGHEIPTSKDGPLRMIELNFTMKKTARHITMSSSSLMSGGGSGRRKSSGWKNITGEDAIPVRRTF